MTCLTEEQVKERIKNNLVNIDTNVKTKSIKTILFQNIFTLFNIINLILGLSIFLTGSYKNMLFLGVIFCNTFISILQEIRSKKTIDNLSLLVETKANVIRDNKEKEININEIVKDDTIIFKIGNQIMVDSKILDGNVLVNESFITGESEPIYKNKGEILLSGSFIVSGKCICKVCNVGLDNYTSKISNEAKYIKKVNSEIMRSLEKIIKIVSIIIFPIGLLLFINQICLSGNTFNNSIINTVAALVSMIPEGLVLLTSTVLAVSVIKLSKYNVLVQSLYCIETLARVDTICFDKTGTLTEGKMEVKDIINFKGNNEEILREFCNALNDNATSQAIIDKLGTSNKFGVESTVPFSSENKYSKVTFKNKRTFILGAPEFILKDTKESDKYSDYRVLALCEERYRERELLCLILIQDKIRKESYNTINYFKKQGVDVKIISGDNPKTVHSVASRINLNLEKYVDVTNMEDKDLKNNLNCSIFGRVKPNQKKTLIKLLKEQGHVVAYVGDGVNDVLALKESDCSIALANGSDAARNVSELVLMDSSFDSMPKIVDEGRKIINNIERSASLFIVKTIYATILAILFMFIRLKYPFIPIQLTLTSALTIGIPSFILALEPNYKKIKGNFFINIFSKAIPTSLTIVINIILSIIVGSILKLDSTQISTLAVILTGFTGFFHIYLISRPLNLLRTSLLTVLVLIFIIGVVFFKDLFSLSSIDFKFLIIILIMLVNTLILFILMTNLFHKYIYKLVKKVADKK